jgi:uncharacterized delta-60 repeat protein
MNRSFSSAQSDHFYLFSKNDFFLRLTQFFIIVALVVANEAVRAQPAALDTSWGVLSSIGQGKVVTPIGAGYARTQAIALLPDGKALLAGYCKNGTNDDFCALRYNAEGFVDRTWNGTGLVITSLGATSNLAHGVALQPDGKALLAGTCGNGITTFAFCAVRYNADGSLDNTWNGTGKVITPVGIANGGSAYALALQPDGKVLLAGSCINTVGPSLEFCVIRYNADGSLDTDWNGTGTVITPMSDGNDVAYAIKLQPDGKVLLAGYCRGDDFSDDFCAARYNSNGTLDASWSSDGKVVTAVGTSTDRAYAVALQPDGKVLLAGACVNTFDDFCSVRYNADGSLDTDWNGAGKAITSTGITAAADTAYGLALQPDGKVLLAGVCYNGTNGQDFCTMRYNANGTLDTSWNATGIAITPVDTTNNVAKAIALYSNGAILVAGSCFTGGVTEGFCAIRYKGGPVSKTCSLDIDGDGAVRFATDGLTIARYLRPHANTASLVGGIVFPSNALRSDAASISNFLDTSNFDFDGDGMWYFATDGVILLRVLLGFTGSAVTEGIPFTPNATRTDWTTIRSHLNTQCGMQIP